MKDRVRYVIFLFKIVFFRIRGFNSGFKDRLWIDLGVYELGGELVTVVDFFFSITEDYNRLSSIRGFGIIGSYI